MFDDVISRLNTALHGRYRVERELGEGGMARVYLARDLRHDRRVALKVLKADLAAAVGAERFLTEIKTTAHLQHPHVLPLFDSGEAHGFLYYVMPYVEGESLRERLDREYQLPVDEAIRIATDVAEALDYAHRRGVIHRDIKPSNILLQDGRAVVSDFGIALAVGRSDRIRLTETGRSIGTPQYMSPEQATGEREVDARTDVYALGSVLYEMLAGEPPYTAATPEAVLSKKLITEPPAVRVLRDTVPRGVERVLARALARSPADRPKSAGELARALTEGSAERDAVGDRATSPRWAVITVGVLLVVAVARTGWWAFGPSGGTAGPSITSLVVLPPENLSGDPEQDVLLERAHVALIGQLQGISGLRTISRTSAVRVAELGLSLTEVARQLDVDAVVEWSAETTGDTLRGRWSLMQARPSERSLVSTTFERPMRDVLSFYDELTRAIAKASGVTLTSGEVTRLADAREVDPEAYRLVALADYYNGLLTDEAYARALPLLDSAIAIDSLYAPAHAEIAGTYGLMGSWFAERPLPARAVIPRIREGVDRALALDSTDARAITALVTLRIWYEWDWEGAERLLYQGLEMNPSIDLYWAGESLYVFLGDLEKAVEMAELAVELDPLSAAASGRLADAFIRAGRLDDAFLESRRLNPTVGEEDFRPVEYYAREGDYDRALSLGDDGQSPSAWNDLAYRGELYGLAGREVEAHEVLSILLARRAEEYMPASAIARVYLGLGERGEALEWLRKAFIEGDMALVQLKESWEYAPLHGEPRYEELVRQIFPN